MSTNVIPEQGITIYENDPTQGPACAVACGAGTLYRNYFVELGGDIGQSANNQVDCLSEIGEALGNSNGRLWTMTNGYALPTAEGLKEVDARLVAMSEAELDALRCKLRIGLQWQTHDRGWILDAIRRAAKLYRQFDLEVRIVSFRHSYPAVRGLCEEVRRWEAGRLRNSQARSISFRLNQSRSSVLAA